MTIAMFFVVYPVIFIAGAILTQLLGKAHRPFHEGLLAWLFFPIGLLACLNALTMEGVQGLKLYWHEFLETLLNFKYGPASFDAEQKKDAHQINGDFA
jgi:hypothetical protein